MAAREQGSDLVVTAQEGSDAWRLTSYGFVHDSEHALVAPFPADSAMEVEFTAAFSAQFDQAGIFVRVSAERWVKAGVEFTDGSPSSALWSPTSGPTGPWRPFPTGRGVGCSSGSAGAGTRSPIRARAQGGPLQLVRVVPFEPELVASAGPFLCAPTRAGLTVSFHAWRRTERDDRLH